MDFKLGSFNSKETMTFLLVSETKATLVIIPTCNPFKLIGLPVVSPSEFL